MHGVHELGEVVEQLGAPGHALLPLVNGFGQLPDVALAHLVERRLALQSLQWHCRRARGFGLGDLVEVKSQTTHSNVMSCGFG